MSHTLDKVEYLINYSNRSKSPGWEKTRGETSSQDSHNNTIQLLEGYILFSGRHVPRSWLGSVMYQAASWCLRSPGVHSESSLLLPSCSTPQLQCCTGSCLPAQRFVVPSTAIRQANSDLTQGDRQKSMESFTPKPQFSCWWSLEYFFDFGVFLTYFTRLMCHKIRGCLSQFYNVSAEFTSFLFCSKSLHTISQSRYLIIPLKNLLERLSMKTVEQRIYLVQQGKIRK